MELGPGTVPSLLCVQGLDPTGPVLYPLGPMHWDQAPQCCRPDLAYDLEDEHPCHRQLLSIGILFT